MDGCRVVVDWLKEMQLVAPIVALQDIEQLYGVGSAELQLAAQLVRQTINEVSTVGVWFILLICYLQVRDDMVSYYNGKVLVQSLVLLWEG